MRWPIATGAPLVIRMGRFAIDRSYQGLGWVTDLLRESLVGAVNAGQAIGARVMLVDAISDDALAFYLRFGFLKSPIHPMQVLYDLRTVGPPSMGSGCSLALALAVLL